jgi:hypothetical protein
MKQRYLYLLLALAAINAHAGSSTLDAAIGGGIGGATGAAIGNEVGGRDGAIIGGALGAAAGTAITTDDKSGAAPAPRVNYQSAPSNGGRGNGFQCPPGLRKKGAC